MEAGPAETREQKAARILLLDRGADVHHRGDAALFCAALKGHLQIATLLLDRGADPNVNAPWDDGRTALISAQEHGHHQVVAVALLLSRGAID